MPPSSHNSSHYWATMMHLSSLSWPNRLSRGRVPPLGTLEPSPLDNAVIFDLFLFLTRTILARPLSARLPVAKYASHQMKDSARRQLGLSKSDNHTYSAVSPLRGVMLTRVLRLPDRRICSRAYPSPLAFLPIPIHTSLRPYLSPFSLSSLPLG